MDAKKNTVAGPAALKLARGLSKVVAAKGKNVVELDVKSASDAELAALIVGPTGNLRAPAFRVGKTLVVGFEAGAYAAVLK